MAIDESEVRRVARLARLKLSEAETATLGNQLGRILDHMRELGNLDTERVPPTAHVLGLTNVFREDEPIPFEGREKLLENAPVLEGPHIKVPKVIE